MTVSSKMFPALALVLACVACTAAPPRSAPPVEAERASAAGRIRGVVKLRGPAPAERFEPTGKNAEVCGNKVAVTRLALGAENGVKQAFVYLEGVPASDGLHPAASLTVEQKGCVYAPHAMTLAAGSGIEIVNGDPVLHNVHARQTTEAGAQTVFNIAQPIRGQRTKVDSSLKPGIVALTCEAGHPWMTAYILITNHPYVAVTDKDGAFVIEGVPAGTYPIKMWHEGVSLERVIASLQEFHYEEPYELTQQVVVPAGGEARVSFDLELRAASE